MDTMKAFLSFLLSILFLTAIPAARTWAVQCQADLPMVTTTDYASAGDHCHIDKAPDKQPSSPRAIVQTIFVAGPALCKTWIDTTQNTKGATGGRLDVAVHGDMPVFLMTGTLLI